MSEEDMLRGAVGSEVLGLLKDLITKLLGNKGKEWLEALKKFLRKENPWLIAMLQFVKIIELPAIGTFKPEDHIKVTPARECKTAKVVVAYVSDNIKALIKGRSEPDEKKAGIRIHKLCKASIDALILAELGENVKMGFNRVFQMLEKQGHGQEGDLLVDGRANIFYIEGTDWAVFCRWSSDLGGWSFGGDLILRLCTWDAGSQVVSR